MALYTPLITPWPKNGGNVGNGENFTSYPILRNASRITGLHAWEAY